MPSVDADGVESHRDTGVSVLFAAIFLALCLEPRGLRFFPAFSSAAALLGISMPRLILTMPLDARGVPHIGGGGGASPW